MIHYSLMFLLATISFWTVRAQGIVWGYYNLFNIARMPDEAFHGAFRAFFTFERPKPNIQMFSWSTRRRFTQFTALTSAHIMTFNNQLSASR